MAKTFTITRPKGAPIMGSGSFLFDVHEQAAQTFLEGAVLMWDQANSGAKELTGNAGVGLCGLAEEPGHNTTGAKVRTFPLRADSIIEVNLAVAGANTRVLALTDMGALCGFAKRTINPPLHWVVDAPGAGQFHGRIIGVGDSTDGSPDGLPGAIGDTNARVKVAIISVTATASLQIGW